MLDHDPNQWQLRKSVQKVGEVVGKVLLRNEGQEAKRYHRDNSTAYQMHQRPDKEQSRCEASGGQQPPPDEEEHGDECREAVFGAKQVERRKLDGVMDEEPEPR